MAMAWQFARHAALQPDVQAWVPCQHLPLHTSGQRAELPPAGLLQYDPPSCSPGLWLLPLPFRRVLRAVAHSLAERSPLFNAHSLVVLAGVFAVEVAEQAMCMDREGTNAHLAPLRLHGTRRLNGWLCTTLMHIAGCVHMVLLPLGAGYVLGICSEPISASALMSDSILWSQPWQCS